MWRMLFFSGVFEEMIIIITVLSWALCWACVKVCIQLPVRYYVRMSFEWGKDLKRR